MNKKVIAILISIISITVPSCKTDFDVTSEWKEIAVVYGLLNQNDSVHYIKITKAFLGDGDALVMAQNPDSSSYGDNLEVKMEEWRNGTFYSEFYFDTVTVFNKQSGSFYYPSQLVYKSNAILNASGEYKLIVVNKLTGKIITSHTNLIKPFTIDKPNPLQQINFATVNPAETKWSSAVNGKLYQVSVRFYYTETNINTNVVTSKFVDWIIGSKTSATSEGGEVMTIEYTGESFFENIGSKLAVNPDLKRQEGRVEFIITVAGEEFNTYMEINKPPSTIVQEKPEYSNIVNGIGIFSCRYDNTKDNQRLLSLTARSSDSLKNGRFTNMLGF